MNEALHEVEKNIADYELIRREAREDVDALGTVLRELDKRGLKIEKMLIDEFAENMARAARAEGYILGARMMRKALTQREAAKEIAEAIVRAC